MKLSLLSYLRSAQSQRDALCLCLFLLAGAGYEHFLGAYFGGIPQKTQLSLAFTGSLMFGLWYEFKFGDWRGSLIRLTGITLVFMGAAYLAPYVRHEYFVLMAEAQHVPRVVEVFTAEGLALMANPLAGFGGCFGLSLVATRVVCGTVFVRALSFAVKHDATVHACPHCQGAIPR
jgi:hypothetical protein